MQLDKEGFKDWLGLKGLSEKSIADYLYYAKKFEMFSEITQDSVESFLKVYDCSGSRGFLNNYLTYLIKHKDRFNLDLKELERLREIELPKKTGRDKIRLAKVLSKYDLEQIESRMVCERDKLMFWVCFYGGLRVSELCNIKINDFDWKNWANHPEESIDLKVIGKGDKQRMVFVPAFIVKRIHRWLENYGWEYAMKKNKENPIWALKKRSFEDVLQTASTKALGKSIYPHALRSTCATFLLRNGMDLIEVRDYLGHSSVATTQIYVTSDKTKLKENIHRITSAMQLDN